MSFVRSCYIKSCTELLEILFQIQTYLEMAEKANAKRITSAARSSHSKRSTLARPLRVIHISNPTVVKTSASEFRAVVQSLTGLKRSSASHDHALDLYSDQNSPQVKIPKLEDGLQCAQKDKDTSESDLNHDKPTVSECCNGKNDGDVRIFEDLDAEPIEFPDYITRQYQLFETQECFVDAMHLLCPSILFPEFENLY